MARRKFDLACKPHSGYCKFGFSGGVKLSVDWDWFRDRVKEPARFREDREGGGWRRDRLELSTFIATDDFKLFGLDVQEGASFKYGSLRTLSLLALDYDGGPHKSWDEVLDLMAGKTFVIYASKSNDREPCRRFRLVFPVVVRDPESPGGLRDYVFVEELERCTKAVRDYFGFDDPTCKSAHLQLLPVVKEDTVYSSHIGEGDVFDLTELLAQRDPPRRSSHGNSPSARRTGASGGATRSRSRGRKVGVGESFRALRDAEPGKRHAKLASYVGTVVRVFKEAKLGGRRDALVKQLELVKCVPFFRTDGDEVRSVVRDICRKEGIDIELE